MILSPGETNVLCTDLDRSLAFYRDVLGYRVVGHDQGAIRLALGSQQLLLLPIASAPAADTAYGDRAELSFDLRTADLPAAVAHLAGCGVVFETPWDPGQQHIVIRDPDGLRIEVVAVTGSNHQIP